MREAGNMAIATNRTMNLSFLPPNTNAKSRIAAATHLPNGYANQEKYDATLCSRVEVPKSAV